MKFKFLSVFGALVASFLFPSLAAAAQIEIPLKKITGTDYTVNDAEYGVTMTFPASWQVTRAARWGENSDKTTVLLQRSRPTPAAVSFFYQKFGAEGARPPEIKDWFRSSFQEKQAAKQKELSNYQNDPRSLTYGTTAGGLPRCSYMATFTKDSRTMVEYYVRVAGEKTYVMFLTQGTPAQIESMRGDIDQMADTVQLP